MNDPNVAQIKLRRAGIDDVDHIHALLKSYSDAGNLLPRSAIEIENNLSDFCVVSSAQEILACGALEVFTRELGEVRSLAVSRKFTKGGLGTMVVEHIIEDARARGLERLMALTYVPGFFHGLGFKTVDKEVLPEKVWGVCVKCYKFKHCDEIAVLRPI